MTLTPSPRYSGERAGERAFVFFRLTPPFPTTTIRPMSKTIHHPVLAPLKAQFPSIKFLAGSFRDMVTVVVPRENILEICRFLRDDPKLRYDMLLELNGVDYLNFPGTTHRFAV